MGWGKRKEGRNDREREEWVERRREEGNTKAKVREQFTDPAEFLTIHCLRTWEGMAKELTEDCTIVSWDMDAPG